MARVADMSKRVREFDEPEEDTKQILSEVLRELRELKKQRKVASTVEAASLSVPAVGGGGGDSDAVIMNNVNQAIALILKNVGHLVHNAEVSYKILPNEPIAFVEYQFCVAYPLQINHEDLRGLYVALGAVEMTMSQTHKPVSRLVVNIYVTRNQAIAAKYVSGDREDMEERKVAYAARGNKPQIVVPGAQKQIVAVMKSVEENLDFWPEITKKMMESSPPMWTTTQEPGSSRVMYERGNVVLALKSARFKQFQRIMHEYVVLQCTYRAPDDESADSHDNVIIATLTLHNAA